MIFRDHDVPPEVAERRAERRQSPALGDDIFVGAGAKIIGAVHVGTGAKVGANAVMVRDVPAYSTVVGIPARVVRQAMPQSESV